jgi:hypothetical protein
MTKSYFFAIAFSFPEKIYLLLSFIRCLHGTYFDTGATACTEFIVYGDYIIDHIDGYFRAKINAPSTSGTFTIVNFCHSYPPFYPVKGFEFL